MQTVHEALQQGQTVVLRSSDAPDLDTERLLLSVIGRLEPSWLHAHGDEKLTQDQAARFKTLLADREAGKPLAYLLGEAEFFGRAFFVNESVLIPRPETEKIIEQALAYARKHAPAVIADIGTGSGCIAITLAMELPDTHIIATDISPDALAVARNNARRHGVLGRIEFLEGDMLKPLDFAQGKPHVDLIVSNPPYVPTAEVARAGSTADTRGLTFEPHIALDGGADGNLFVEQIKTAGTPYIVETLGGELVYELE